MLRLLHTADVSPGARHTDLGERAAVLRERQFAAFPGDDRPGRGRGGRPGPDRRRSVRLQYPASPIRRARRRRTRSPGQSLHSATVIIPGTHDVYDGALDLPLYDLAAMARTSPEWITVLTPEQQSVWLPSLDAWFTAVSSAPNARPRAHWTGSTPEWIDERTWATSAWSMARWPFPARRRR